MKMIAKMVKLDQKRKFKFSYCLGIAAKLRDIARMIIEDKA